MQRVGDAMGQERVDTRPRGQHLQGADAPRSRVPGVRCRDVVANLTGYPGDRAEAKHPWRSVAVSPLVPADETFRGQDVRHTRATVMPLRVLILHGWRGSGLRHWQTWLAHELRRAGAAVRYPELPACETPCPDRWGAALHPELAALAAAPGDGERVVVCHSLGCVLWLREAHRIAPEHRVDRVALVSPPCPGSRVPELAPFYPSGAEKRHVEAAARGRTLLVCSDNDPYCPNGGAREHWGDPLGLEADVLPSAGHLNAEAGFGPWPAMADWVIGARDRIVGA